MSDSREIVWGTALEALDAARPLQEATADVLDRCADLVPEAPWDRFPPLALRADRELLPRAVLEARGSGEAPDELRFDLLRVEWRGRLDSLDLGVAATADGRSDVRALGSRALGQLGRWLGSASADEGRNPGSGATWAAEPALAETLPLALAALLAHAIVRRLPESYGAAELCLRAQGVGELELGPAG